MENDLNFLRRNKLMDYSLLLIKVKNEEKKENPLKRMPALVYVKQKNGINQLQMKQIDESKILRKATMIQKKSQTPSNLESHSVVSLRKT